MDKPRIKLLGREEVRKANPFFLCNLIARRAQQLLDGNAGRGVHQAISIAIWEFVNGDLKFETTTSNASATAADMRSFPAGSAEGSVRLIETHDEVLASADPR